MHCPRALTYSRDGGNFFPSLLDAIQLPQLPRKMEPQLSACLCLKPVSQPWINPPEKHRHVQPSGPGVDECDVSLISCVSGKPYWFPVAIVINYHNQVA